MKLLKTIGKRIVVAVLAWQLKRLQARNQITTIGIVGSYGKTSTKFAVATVLQKHFKVRYQKGNYNDLVTVPLVFFDEGMPNLLNPIGWIKLFIRNERQLQKSYDYDVVILELGTDGPGQIIQFNTYLNLNFTIITSIAYEHMEYFTDLDAVAAEELSVQTFSKAVIVNADLCDEHYIASLTSSISFGQSNYADFKITNVSLNQTEHSFAIVKNDTPVLKAHYTGISNNQMYSGTAAAIVAQKLGMPDEKIIAGIAAISPVSGRMQLLKGIKNSTILDDTYNSSPSAAKGSLDLLYSMSAPQKIALLGNMNELGTFSKAAHEEIGAYCNPQQLTLVVTLGPDANKYLAPAAQARGCTVQPCTTPYEAAHHIEKVVQDSALILAKGSQNKVYAEEAVKLLLANPNDAKLLVRQSPAWLKKKTANF